MLSNINSSKKDWIINPKIISKKDCEIWANTDSLGRNVIYRDSNYKIVVDSFNEPKVVRLLTQSTTLTEKKVGELVCFEKKIFDKSYMYLKYISIEDAHNGCSYSYRMINSLISILNKSIYGLITPYKQRINHKDFYILFSNLGGYVNDFGYLEIKNPKNN